MSQRAFAFLLTLATLLPFAASAYGLEDLDEWEFITDSNGTLVVGEDGSVTLGGANNPLPEQPRWDALTSLTTTALEAETAQYLWSYLTTDSAHYDKPQYLVGGEWLTLAEGNTQSATGYIEVMLAAGDLFGFRVLSTDSCCGIGFLTIVAGSPTPEPTSEPTPEPTQTPEPTPEPTLEPTPEPTVQPTPEPTPEPTLPLSPQPSEEPSIEPTPEATQPNETSSPEPTTAPSEQPSETPVVSPDPTPVSTPEPEPDLPDIGEAVSEAAGAAVEAVADALGDIAAIGEIGKDLDATEKEEAQPMAVAVISSQIASVAAAAANAARTTGGTSGGGGGGGGGDMKAARSRKGRR